MRAPEEYLLTCLRTYDRRGDGLPVVFREQLLRVLRHYGLDDLGPSSDVAETLMRVYRSQQRLDGLVAAVAAILDRRLARIEELRTRAIDELRGLLDHIIAATDGRYPSLSDLARDVRFRFFEQPVLLRAQAQRSSEMERHIELMAAGEPGERAEHLAALVACPQPMRAALLRWYQRGDAPTRDAVLEVATSRYYRTRDLTDIALLEAGGNRLAVAEYDHDSIRFHLMVAFAPVDDLVAVIGAARLHLADTPEDRGAILDLHLWRDGEPDDVDVVAERLRRTIASTDLGRPAHRIDLTITAEPPDPRPAVTYHYTFRSRDGDLVEDARYRNLHPMLAKRLAIERFGEFALTRLASAEDVYLFHGVAHDNPKDERLFVLAEVRDLTPVRDDAGRAVAFPLLERILMEILAAVRRFQSHRPPERRLLENLVILYVRPPWTVPVDYWRDLAHKLAPVTRGLGIERRHRPGGDARARRRGAPGRAPRDQPRSTRRRCPPDRAGRQPDRAARRVRPEGHADPTPRWGLSLRADPAAHAAGRRALGLPRGRASSSTTSTSTTSSCVSTGPPARTPPTSSSASSATRSPTIPEGMHRVFIAGDPSRSLGALAEAECRRIIAALDLAEQLGVPVEWFALSSGARISMTSGTENMDWIGAVLRRIITFTQTGGAINIVVTGINVGAQPYWNAEATMLMHTRGILVMVPESAMVLTGKQALDFSGGVSAEDNLGIGGFERIMGPNGQAQYSATDIESACEILFRHYDHTYVVPGERFPRRATTGDPLDRDVCRSPHARGRGQRLHQRRRHLLHRTQPRTQEGIRHPIGDARRH